MTTMPTDQQITETIAAHVRGVGRANASLLEVALALDLACPGMSDGEFVILKEKVAPLVAAERRQGVAEIWK